MTAMTTDLKPNATEARVGFHLDLSPVLLVIARTLADFNRYMNAAQHIQNADHHH